MTSSPTEPLTSPSPSNNPQVAAPTAGVTAPPLRVTGVVTNNAGDRWEIPSPTTSPGDGGDGGPADPLDGQTASTATPSSDETTIPVGSLKEFARGLVLAATDWVAARVSRGDDEKAALLVATEKEQAAIGDPLVKIAGRHAKIPTGGNPDMGDLVAAGIAAGGYLVRAVRGLWNLKRHRDAVRAAATADPVEGVHS